MKTQILLCRLAFCGLLACRLSAQTSITTYHYDNHRTGWNQAETVLTPATVWAPNFALLHTAILDDQADAQPLVMPGISITAGNNQGMHDIVYVATANNTVYAIDVHSGTILLSANFGTPVPRTALPVQCGNNGPNVGITSTPVIDPVAHTLYVMAYTNDGPTYRLHALDLGSLTDKVPPEVVAASQNLFPAGTFTFNAKYQRQRPALLLANGNVYAGFGSFCDAEPSLSRGWLLGWNASTLQPLSSSRLLDTQASDLGNYFLSSIWMSGYGPAADDLGNILFVTGNSDNQAETYDGLTNLQESVVKVSPDLSTVVDLFTPKNQWQLDQVDYDFGSGGVLVLPDQPGSTPHLAVAAGKDGNMYFMNEDHLGGYSSSTNSVLATYPIGKCWCGESYYVDPKDGLGRVVTSSGNSANQLQTWRVVTAPSVALNQVSAIPLGTSLQDPGFFTAISSNGTASPLIWAVTRPGNSTTRNVNLWAFDPDSGGTIPTALLNTNAGVWPNLGGNANLVPVVANGQVYVASYQQLQIFGLTANNQRVEAIATAAATVACSYAASPVSPWTNPSAASSPGTSFASSAISVNPPAASNSQCLDATGFHFSIPSTAKIIGIEVSSVVYVSPSTVPVTFTETLLNNGTPMGTARSFTTQKTTAARYLLGTSTNRWGALLTPAIVNQPNFGVSIQAWLNTTSQSSATAYLDNVQITLFYTP